MNEEPKFHEPVMVREVTEALHLKSQGIYIDATLGTGGHTLEIAKRGAKVLGIELDKSILEIAKNRLKDFKKVTLVAGNFKDINKIAREKGFGQVDGILFDLGVANVHFGSRQRGFSFRNEKAPLDMRLSGVGPTGADLLNSLRKDQLSVLFERVMPPREARFLTKRVVETREREPFRVVGDFLKVCQGLPNKKSLHPATRAFLALRIAVNSELENLEEALPAAFSLLKAGGRLAIISFHSLEERKVKDFFRERVEKGEGKLPYKKPVVPGEVEIERNARARSAKLRVIEKR